VKKILIVDDQRGIRLLLDEIFKKEGVKTYLASNGQEALQLLEKAKMDCVLLDMKLPGMDGRELLKRMKTLYPDMPVFMMTAYEEIGQENGFGADHYFTKPFNVLELKNTVLEWLNRNNVLSD